MLIKKLKWTTRTRSPWWKPHIFDDFYHRSDWRLVILQAFYPPKCHNNTVTSFLLTPAINCTYFLWLQVNSLTLVYNYSNFRSTETLILSGLLTLNTLPSLMTNKADLPFCLNVSQHVLHILDARCNELQTPAHYSQHSPLNITFIILDRPTQHSMHQIWQQIHKRS